MKDRWREGGERRRDNERGSVMPLS